MQRRDHRWETVLLDCVAAVAAVVLVSVLARTAGLNAPTVALVLHTTVVVLAAIRHFAAGLVAALAATASFSFFLHPEDSWRVAEPANWLALVSFLAASTIIGRLLLLARNQADEAEVSRRHVTTLYRLGVDLLAASEGSDAASKALLLAVSSIDGSSAGLLRRVGESVEIVSWRGSDPPAEVLAECARCLTDGASRTAGIGALRCTATPVDDDEALAFVAPEADATAADSVAALLALTLRHQRAVARAARGDALRESELVRTSLIRAVSHDLNTPLTAMVLELDALERELGDPGASRARLASLKEDAALLRHRIESLLAMARIDAGTYRPRIEPVAPAELLQAAARHLSMFAEARESRIEAAHALPDILADPTLVTEILTNLVDNAHRAAPPGEAIRLVARAGEPGRVVLEVVDTGSGPALDDPRWAHGLPIPVEDLPRRGLGLEIARTFARACNGAVTIRRDAGTIAAIDLPAASEVLHEA